MAANLSPVASPALDVERVRRDFPILNTVVNGHPLVYLDSAASAQRPRAVLRAVEEYETHSHANVHRGVHALSQAATAAYEGARERVRRFINTRGELELEEFLELLGPRTRLVGVAHVSNALGTVLPVKRIIEAAHEVGAVVLIDGAQAVPHSIVDVRALGADFYVFSGHKLYGPTGIGVLYGREELLAAMPPWQGGGDMILTVSFEKTTYNELPWKFEAGTPNISGAVGLAAAMDYLESLGLPAVAAHEQRLLELATAELTRLPGIEIIGTAAHKASVLSFTMKGVHPHDLGTVLDAEGIAVRTGHHCAMPVMTFFGLPATARASFACYNTEHEVSELVRALGKAREVFV